MIFIDRFRQPSRRKKRQVSVSIKVSDIDMVRRLARSRNEIILDPPRGRRLTAEERVRDAWGNLSVENPGITIDEVRNAVQVRD